MCCDQNFRPLVSYQVLGAVPLGEGVADKPTKRSESAL